MPQLVIDASTAEHARGGIGVVTERFLEALAEIDGHDAAVVVAGPNVAVPEALVAWRADAARWSAYRIALQRLGFPALLQVAPSLRGAARVLYLDSYVPLWSQPAEGPSAECFVHDVLPLTHPQYFTARRDVMKRLAFASVRKQRPRVYTSAEFTAGEIRRELGLEAQVVRFGCGQFADAEADAALSRAPPAARPYVAYIGALEARKDIRTLVRGFTLVRDGVADPLQLAIVGDWRMAEGRELRRWVRDLGVEHVRFLGRLSTRDARALLAGASALVYPSLAEGFGLPVLEALAIGTRVVATDLPAITSWAGDTVVTFPPGDPAGLASALREVLAAPRDPGAIARGKALAEGYRWRRFAESLLSG